VLDQEKKLTPFTMAAPHNPLTHALITKLIADLTPEDEWLLGPVGQAIAKLPANGFTWQRGGSPVAIGSGNIGPLYIHTSYGQKPVLTEESSCDAPCTQSAVHTPSVDQPSPCF
jgi:hypothetical protein